MSGSSRRAVAFAGLALAGLVAASAAATAAPRLQLDSDGLDAVETTRSQAALDDARSWLPHGFDALDGTAITVRWSDTLDPSVHGRVRGHEIRLQRRLLAPLVAAGPAGGADDGQAAHAVRAALLHELAHLLDRAAPGGPLSRDPRLLDLAGWQVRATRPLTALAGRLRDNRFVDRSPDPYELHDPAEFVAVNLEHYLLDPEYACRRPALYRHFAKRIGPPRAPAASCAPDLAYVDASAEGGDAEPLSSLDPARVWQVDYLLAEGNERAMSRWGHSMLRLVVCAPDRPRGPDCRLDLAHHRVLSFRAFVDDVQISSWRGLSGRYPSRLFVLPLLQVVDEYTRVELRGLRSLPLRLDDAEVAALLERAAQLHWSYDGRYYFVSNNCAVETFKLLHDGVPRVADAHVGSITPTGLLRKLQRAGFVDASVLDDRAEALRLGYRFDSLRERFDALYDVARGDLALPPRDAAQWLALPPQARAPWLAQGDVRTSAALLVLEQAAQRRLQLEAQERLKRRYLDLRRDDSDSQDADPIDAAVRTLLGDAGYLGRPALLLPEQSGYGLPQASERSALAVASRGQQLRLRQARQSLEAQAKDAMPAADRAALDAVAVNVALVGDRLRQLHREQGGLRLP